MKAVVLAAGLGTRLKPVIGEDTPKVMYRIKNKPLLHHLVEALNKRDIKEIVFVVSHKKEQIMEYFGDGKKFGMHVDYAYQKNPKGGTADAVKSAKDKIKEDKFLLIYGDNIFNPEAIDEILNNHHNFDGILGVKFMQDVSKLGVIVYSGNRVTKIEEKAEKPISNLALTGLFVLPNSIFDAIENTKLSPRGEYELTDSIQLLIDRGFKIGFVNIENFWIDPRNKEELELAQHSI